jgi:hypothetical protein
VDFSSDCLGVDLSVANANAILCCQSTGVSQAT